MFSWEAAGRWFVDRTVRISAPEKYAPRVLAGRGVST